MKRLMLSVSVCAVVAFGQDRAEATTISLGFSNSAGALAQFDGNDPGPGQTGSFTFLNNGSGNNIMIVGSDGTGDSVGLQGAIAGTFDIGTISTFGPVETAPVSGTGSFSLADGSGGFLTGTIDWVDIVTFGSIGGLNATSTVNVSNIAYSGNSIQDFADFASVDDGIAVLSFQFALPKSLTQLTQDGVITNSLSYSGTLSNIPEPSAVILLVSMLSLAALCRRAH